jgi:hypothetical protein
MFLITGWFLLQAGLAEQASKSGRHGRGAELAQPDDQPARRDRPRFFGIFSLIEARYRVIHSPDMPDMPECRGRDKPLNLYLILDIGLRRT